MSEQRREDEPRGLLPQNDESPDAPTSRPSTGEPNTDKLASTAPVVNPNLGAALSYVCRGWSVAPLVLREKRPAVTIAPFLSGATKWGESEVLAHWTKHPDHGVAIIMGAPSGLICLDVDPRNSGDMQAATRDCPTNLAAQTGGGGLHLFVKHPGGRIPKGRTARPGVDRQSDGSYVCAAPSVHPSGGAYSWLNEGEPGELPAWAIEKAAPISPATTGGEPEGLWLAELLAHPEGVKAGCQREAALKLTAWCARHLDVDVGRALARRTILAFTSYRPREPWTQKHADDLIDSAYAKYEPTPGRIAGIVGDTDGVGGGGRKTFTLTSLRELNEKLNHPDYALRSLWLCEDWIGLGPNLIAGPSHVGKTWLLLDLAVSVATGKPFLGLYPVKQGPVLYVAAEDGERVLHDRAMAVRAGKLERQRRDALRLLGEKAAWLEKKRAFAHGAAQAVLAELAWALAYVRLDCPDTTTPAALAISIKAAVAAALAPEMPGDPDVVGVAFNPYPDAGPLPEALYFYTGGSFRFGAPEWTHALFDAVTRLKPRLVIFDPLKDLVSGGAITNFLAEVVEYVPPICRRLRDEFECTSVLVHHTGKDPSRRGTDAAVNANSLLAASFDTRWIIAEAGERAGVITRKSKLGPPQPRIGYRYTVEPDDEGDPLGYFLVELEELDEHEAFERTRPLNEKLKREEKATTRAEAVWQVVKEHGPISARGIKQRLREQGERIRSETVGQYLRELQEAGRVEHAAERARGGSPLWIAGGVSPECPPPAPYRDREADVHNNTLEEVVPECPAPISIKGREADTKADTNGNLANNNGKTVRARSHKQADDHRSSGVKEQA